MNIAGSRSVLIRCLKRSTYGRPSLLTTVPPKRRQWKFGIATSIFIHPFPFLRLLVDFSFIPLISPLSCRDSVFHVRLSFYITRVLVSRGSCFHTFYHCELKKRLQSTFTLRKIISKNNLGLHLPGCPGCHVFQKHLHSSLTKTDK